VSEAALRGQAQHVVLESILRGDELEYVLDQDDLCAVEWAAAWVKTNIGPGLLIEEEVVVLNDDFSELTYGTIDCASKSGKFLIDYKSGDHRDYRAQLAAYAVGLMQRFGHHEIEAAILYGKNMTVETFLIKREPAEKMLREIAAAVNNPDKMPVVCEYCGWCKNMAECHAVSERAIVVAQGRDDWKLENYHSSEITNPEQIAKALDLAKLLAKWCESVKSNALRLCLDGRTIPGYKVKERVGSRKISDVLKVYNRVGLSIENFVNCCDIKVTKLEDVFASENPDLKKRKGDYKMIFEQPLSNVQESIGGFTLAPEGLYVLRCVGAIDAPSQKGKPMITMSFDIFSRQFSGSCAKYPIQYYRVYGGSDLAYLKGDLKAFAASNPGFAWDLNGNSFNEQSLVGCLVGAKISHRLYTTKAGKNGIGLNIDYLCDAAKCSNDITSKQTVAPNNLPF
jgi:hypothetical protein